MTRITVTKLDIIKGGGSSNNCPIARAITRTLRPTSIVVARSAIQVNGRFVTPTFEDLPETNVSDWIHDYDRGARVDPFQFNLDTA